MNPVAAVLCVFSALGALDSLAGNRFGLGKPFEEGMEVLGTLALSMIGMIVMAPVIGALLTPLLRLSSGISWLEPSVLAGSLLANDMGGASLAAEIAKTPESGAFNGLIVGSMLGATLSFTLPVALGTTEKRQHSSILLGLMCGIAVLPVGCFAAGLIAGIPLRELAVSLIPLLLFAGVLTVGLLKAPEKCIRIFRVFGVLVKIVITVGLMLGIVQLLTGWKPIPTAAPVEEGALICFNAACVMTGALPLLTIIGKLFGGGIRKLAGKVGINEPSALGFLSTLATNVTTFSMMKEMDDKGVVLNAAFAVSASFTFADHLAFTLSFGPDCLPAVVAGKLISGILAVLAAEALYRRKT